MEELKRLIPKHGGYRGLKSLQVAQLIYYAMVRFCAAMLLELPGELQVPAATNLVETRA